MGSNIHAEAQARQETAGERDVGVVRVRAKSRAERRREKRLANVPVIPDEFQAIYRELDDAGEFGVCKCSCKFCRKDLHHIDNADAKPSRYCNRLPSAKRDLISKGAYDFKKVSREDMIAQRAGRMGL